MNNINEEGVLGLKAEDSLSELVLEVNNLSQERAKNE
jgi:hypothetical protein